MRVRPSIGFRCEAGGGTNWRCGTPPALPPSKAFGVLFSLLQWPVLAMYPDSFDYFDVPLTALVWRLSARKKGAIVARRSWEIMDLLQELSLSRAPLLFLATETAILASESLGAVNCYLRADPGLYGFRRVCGGTGRESLGNVLWRTKYGWRGFNDLLGLRWRPVPGPHQLSASGGLALPRLLDGTTVARVVRPGSG